MTQTDISRRAFLGGAAAAATLAAVPALPAPAAVPVVEAAPAVAAAKPMFGFSTIDDLWEIDFPTREAALRAAREYHGDDGDFKVGEVCRLSLEVPYNLNEAAAQALVDGGEMFDRLTEHLAGCNEDSNFDGELDEELARVWEKDHEEMDAQCRAAIAAAIIRAGDPVIAARAATSDRRKHDLSDDLFEAIAGDAELQAGLHRIITAWIDKHDLWEAGHGLQVSNVVTYPPAPNCVASI